MMLRKKPAGASTFLLFCACALHACVEGAPGGKADAAGSHDSSNAQHDASTEASDAPIDEPIQDASQEFFETSPSCPGDLPPHDLRCVGSLSCEYSVDLQGCAKRPVRATCDGSSWDVPLPATCGPLSAQVTCDPIGTWALSYGAVSTDECDPGSLPTEVEISLGEGGRIETRFPDQVSALLVDGCTLAVIRAWSVTSPTTGAATETLGLSLSGDSGIGTFSCEGTGGLAGSWSRVVIATRQ